MAQLPGGPFDATTVDPANSIKSDPAFIGWHPMHIVESEMKATKKGDGQYLQLVAKVLDGPFKGRPLWVRLNLVNPNQTAVDIAQRELSAICHAVGMLHIGDSQQLHHRPFLGNVEFKPASGTNPAGNELSGYKPMAGGQAPAPTSTAPTAATPAAPAQASAPAATSAAPPWARKAG